MARAALEDTSGSMRRFYERATLAEGEGGIAVVLDGRAIRTPARNLLTVPTEELAQAIAAEWNVQGEQVDPSSMPLTGLANAAIDRVSPDPAAFARTLAAYGETDLLCYRADAPRALVERQAASWDPLLEWARGRFEVEFEVASGVIPRAQPEATVERIARIVPARSVFQLAGLAPLVTVSGSLIVALALAEGAIGLGQAWQAATLDEAWQAEQWGEDPLAVEALASRRSGFESAYLFLTLL